MRLDPEAAAAGFRLATHEVLPSTNAAALDYAVQAARGLGVAWTTEHLKREEEIAQILGIPYPDVTQCGLLPVAYSIGTKFKPAARIKGTELTHWDGW